MTAPYELRIGDALRLLLDVPNGTVDGVITDPPYSSGGATRGDRTQSTVTKYVQNDSGNQLLPDFEGDNRDQRSFGFWCSLWYAECLRATVDGGILLAFTDWRQLPVTTDAVQAGGWVWRAVVPWNKTVAATRPQSGRFRAQCEYVVFATKGPHQPYDGAPCLPGFFEHRTPRERIHIAQKPIELMRELVQLVRPGGLILDPFAGSGTTGIAALREGRRVLLFEVGEVNAEIIKDRLQAELEHSTRAERRAGQASLFGTPKP